MKLAKSREGFMGIAFEKLMYIMLFVILFLLALAIIIPKLRRVLG